MNHMTKFIFDLFASLQFSQLTHNKCSTWINEFTLAVLGLYHLVPVSGASVIREAP